MAETQHITTRPDSRRARAIGLALGAALALSACSGASEQASVPTVELEPVTTTAAPTTTTTESTTTTEHPNAAYDRDVAEITEVYDTHLAYFGRHDVIVNRDALESTAVDPLLARRIKNIASWQGQGFVAGATIYDFRLIEISILQDRATLETCNFGGAELLSADGSQVIIPADLERYLWTTEYRRTDVGWRIFETAYTNGKATVCDD